MNDAKTGVDILIESSEKCEPCIAGDFKPIIRDGKLFLHPDVLSVFSNINFRPKNLLEFVNYIDTYPTSVDKTFDWPEGSTRNFYEGWKPELRDYISDDLLNYVPKQHGMGAKSPRE